MTYDRSRVLQDDQLSKYEKWYKTLKAGAKAKQRSQSHHQDGPAGGPSATNSFSSIDAGSMTSDGGTGSGYGRTSTNGTSYNSFTSSSSFHDPSAAIGIGGRDLNAYSNAYNNASRPPAHPNRRVL